MLSVIIIFCSNLLDDCGKIQTSGLLLTWYVAGYYVEWDSLSWNERPIRVLSCCLLKWCGGVLSEGVRVSVVVHVSHLIMYQIFYYM